MQHQAFHPALEELGWTSYFHQQFLSWSAEMAEPRAWAPLRIVAEMRGEYRVAGAQGLGRAVLSGRLAQQPANDRPCVGDFVLAESSAGSELSRIEHVFERMSLFRRKVAGHTSDAQPIAANVDLAVVVSALSPEAADAHAARRALNLRGIERYLHAVAQAPARAVLAVSKADLRSDLDVGEWIADLGRELGGTEVVLVSAHTGQGLSELGEQIGRGVTAVLVGPSGVGKSSLTNALLGRAVQHVEALREADLRGRHTTTHRELFALPNGGLLIDTPGMREFTLFADGATDTQRTGFDEIDALAADCRFRDCRHEDEPGCAVLLAVARGEIPAARLEHSHKLRRELAWQQARHDAQQRKIARQQHRILSRAVRTGQRTKGRDP